MFPLSAKGKKQHAANMRRYPDRYPKKKTSSSVIPRTSKPVVFSRNISSKAFFPEKLVTVLQTSASFYYVAGRMTAAAGNYYTLNMTSLNGVMQVPTYSITSGTGGFAFGNNATYVQGSAYNDRPIGYTSFGSIYGNYRVTKYKVTIMLQPAASGDTSVLSVVPLGGEEIPSGVAGNVDVRVMESQPYSKTKVVTFTAASSAQTIVLTGYPWRDLGLTRQQYMDYPPTLIASTPASAICDYVGVFAQQLNGANNGSTVVSNITVSQEIEFSGLAAPLA